MSAQSLEVITILFNEGSGDDSAISDFQRLNNSISFDYLTSFDLRTLSTNSANSGSDVRGLLFTPDLAHDDPCFNASAKYVPANVTRQANLPDTDFNLIALAPWISPTCTQAYLASARMAPIRAFLFYLPDNGTETPPLANSVEWGLGDGGKWKKLNKFPVYALPGSTGQMLMQESALYSMNITDVPNGDTLAKLYDPRDYVRLFIDIDTGSGTSLPSLWVFLLVVLGILLGIIGLTSLMMHWLQLRRRHNLRRRVANGEVDLEALGIKRLTVPQEVLDKMTLYTYGTAAPVAASQPVGKIDDDGRSSRSVSPPPFARPTPVLPRQNSYRPTPLQQPTCAICLDDFVAASDENNAAEGTIVRELPCHHIFHPECVDAFLRDNSSLCPMCKKTCLPTGYCPKAITNAMVRRERMVRRIRERIVEEPESSSVADSETSPQRFSRRLRAFSPLIFTHPHRHRVASAPLPTTQMSDLAPISPVPMPPATLHRSSTNLGISSQGNRVQPPSNPNRREWARQRALAMLGQRTAPTDLEAEEAEHTTGWRKVLGGILPGVGGR